MTAGPTGQPALDGREHLRELRRTVSDFERHLPLIDRWGCHAARVLSRRGRLLAAGNGGSAAEAQHLTAELVGRFRDDREPLSAISLHAETSSLTAILNDYGPDEVFARQVLAHGRRGDLLVLLSTSGRSANLLAAAAAGRREGLTVWSLTGAAPNPLAEASCEALCVDAPTTAIVQELHLTAVHLLAAAVDAALNPTQGIIDLADLADRAPRPGAACEVPA